MSVASQLQLHALLIYKTYVMFNKLWGSMGAVIALDIPPFRDTLDMTQLVVVGTIGRDGPGMVYSPASLVVTGTASSGLIWW